MCQAFEASSELHPIVLLYEHLAANPHEEFTRLFDDVDARRPVDFDEIISSYCEAPGSSDPYEVRRLSSKQLYKWRKNLSTREIEEVMDGYRQSGMTYYLE
jgi:hypothetical protein